MEARALNPISFKRHRFPPDVIRYAVWLYFRFTLSIRDVEDLLAQRGIEVSREAVRCWVNKFGPLIAANLRRRRSRPTGRGAGSLMINILRFAAIRPAHLRSKHESDLIQASSVPTRRDPALGLAVFPVHA
jgi:hypothetical protein